MREGGYAANDDGRTMLAAWTAELDAMDARLASRFGRAELRDRARDYLRGLLSGAERKNGWQLAEEVGNTTPYGLQHLVGRASWDADAVRDDLARSDLAKEPSMGDIFPTYKVAAIQAAPVFMDRDASVAKACQLIAEAGANGATLAVFGETWLPGYPIWLDVAPGAGLWNHQPAKDIFTRLVANAVEVPGPAMEALGGAAAEAGCAVVMGINERERGRAASTLYNSIVYLGSDGQLLGKHRKLTPTYTERLVWGSGDGRTLRVFDTPMGQVGGLVCWEHWMPLARHAMHVTGEQIHAALWPTVHDMHLVASRHYAFEGRCFVVAVGSVLRRDQVPDDLSIFHRDGIEPERLLLAGGSAIIGPDGRCLAGPLGDEEAILYADLDLARIPAEQLTFDAVGHYGRPDVFTLTVNTAPQSHLNLEDERTSGFGDSSTRGSTDARC